MNTMENEKNSGKNNEITFSRKFLSFMNRKIV